MFRTAHAIMFWTLINIGIAITAGGLFLSDCEEEVDPGEGEGESLGEEGEGEGEGEGEDAGVVNPSLPKAEVHRYTDCGHKFGRTNCAYDCFGY